MGPRLWRLFGIQRKVTFCYYLLHAYALAGLLERVSFRVGQILLIVDGDVHAVDNSDSLLAEISFVMGVLPGMSSWMS